MSRIAFRNAVTHRWSEIAEPSPPILSSFFIYKVSFCCAGSRWRDLGHVSRCQAGIAVFGSCGILLKRVDAVFFPVVKEESRHALRAAADIC